MSWTSTASGFRLKDRNESAGRRQPVHLTFGQSFAFDRDGKSLADASIIERCPLVIDLVEIDGRMRAAAKVFERFEELESERFEVSIRNCVYLTRLVCRECLFGILRRLPCAPSRGLSRRDSSNCPMARASLRFRRRRSNEMRRWSRPKS